MSGPKTTNSTDGFDVILGIHEAVTEGPDGKAYGAGNTQKEANQSSRDHYDRQDSNYVPKR